MKKLYKIIGIILSFCIPIYFIIRSFQKKLLLLEEKREKFKRYYNCLNIWIKNLHSEINICTYFYKNNYKNIAIYGYGEIGKRLYEELENTAIKVLYAIDKYDDYDSQISIYDIEQELPKVDAIIVTAINDFNIIKKNLQKKINIPVISIEEVIGKVTNDF